MYYKANSYKPVPSLLFIVLTLVSTKFIKTFAPTVLYKHKMGQITVLNINWESIAKRYEHTGN